MSCVIPFNQPNPGLTPSQSIPTSGGKSKLCLCLCEWCAASGCVCLCVCLWVCLCVCFCVCLFGFAWLCVRYCVCLFGFVWLCVWYCVCLFGSVWLCVRLEPSEVRRTNVGRYPSPSSTMKPKSIVSISVSRWRQCRSVEKGKKRIVVNWYHKDLTVSMFKLQLDTMLKYSSPSSTLKNQIGSFDFCVTHDGDRRVRLKKRIVVNC